VTVVNGIVAAEATEVKRRDARIASFISAME
jgi:hypothetical protein